MSKQGICPLFASFALESTHFFKFLIDSKLLSSFISKTIMAPIESETHVGETIASLISPKNKTKLFQINQNIFKCDYYLIFQTNAGKTVYYSETSSVLSHNLYNPLFLQNQRFHEQIVE